MNTPTLNTSGVEGHPPQASGTGVPPGSTPLENHTVPGRANRTAALAAAVILVVLYLACPPEWDPADRLLRIVAERGQLFLNGNDSMTMAQFAALQLRFVLHEYEEGLAYLRIMIWLLPALALSVWAWSDRIRIDRVQAIGHKARQHAGILVAGMALLAGTLSFTLAVRVLEKRPITLGDEYNYLFQAKLLAQGRLYAEPPPVAPEAFRNRAFVLGERWHGIGFGGHPLALSLGVLVGSANLIPSLWAAISVILTYHLVTTLYDKTTGLLAAGMLALSPLFLFYHATLLPESTNLVFLLLFLMGVARGVRSPARWPWIVAALALALGIVTRPQTTIMACLPVGIWLLLRRGVVPGVRVQQLAMTGLGLAAGILGLWTYAHLVSGEPFGRYLSPGYHHDEVGGATCLGIENAMLFTRYSLYSLATWFRLNFALLGWPISLVAVWWWVRRSDKTTWDFLFFAMAASIFWLYWIYPLQHEQYFVEAGQILIMLGAIGTVAALRRDIATDPRRAQTRIALIVSCYLLAVISVWPFRVSYFEQRSRYEREVWAPIHQAELRNAIVFLDRLGRPMMNCVGRNSPTLDDEVLLVRHFHPAEAARIAEAFPDRATYRLSRASENTPLRLEPYTISHEGVPQVRKEDDLPGREESPQQKHGSAAAAERGAQTACVRKVGGRNR